MRRMPALALITGIAIAFGLSASASDSYGQQQFACGSSDSIDYQPQLDYFLGKSAPATVELRVVFVDFADNPDQQYTDAMAAGLWAEFSGFIDRQSRGALNLDIEVVRNPSAPDEVWTAYEVTNRYASAESYGEYPRYQPYWLNSERPYGELQAEIFLKIQAAYVGMNSPFDGADLIVFVYLPAGGGNPIRSGVGGIGYLYVQQSMFPILQNAAPQPGSSAVPFGFICNWWGGGQDFSWSMASTVAHEFGHAIGLGHPISGDPAIPVCGTSSYMAPCNFGPYNLMRRYQLGGRPFQPFHERDLVKLGWLDRVEITSNVRNLLIADVRSGGSVYYIDGLDPYPTTVFGSPALTKEQFSIALHGGFGDDARPIPGDGLMYKSRGLAVWHTLEVLLPTDPDYLAMEDLESAYGRYQDPVNRLGADPVLGQDNMDVFFDRSLGCATRSPSEAGSYPGGASDFFSGTRNEFSYRSNPNTSCYGNDMTVPPGVFWFWPFLPQEVPNSIVIRIREDYGDSMLLDILLAPYEDIMSPNGGEILQVGQPYAIAWDKEFTTDQPSGIINTVDIYCSHGEGYDDQLLVAGVNATLGSYQWTPTAAHVSKTCKIRIVYHNVNDAAHVGEDESDAVFTVVDLPAAKFTDVSSLTGLVPPGVPYSAAPGDFQADEMNDLVIDATGGDVVLGHVYLIQSSGVPLFGNTTVGNVADGRGVVVADFDNDGDQDFFMAHETDPRLYRNQNGTFFDVSGPLASSAAPSTAACWGDYDRDGWLDLYVVRSSKGHTEPPDYLNIAGEGHRLFRNLGATGGGFADVTVAAGIASLAGNGSVSASWGDIENDGDLDLIVTNLQEPPTGPGGIGTHLFVNQGNGTFIEEFLDRFPGEFFYCTAAQWADMNNDGFLDLAVSCAQGGSAIYFNDGSGHFPAADRVWCDASGNGYNGVQVFDHDLDGWNDVLWISRSTSEPSQFFSGVPTATGVGFVNNTAHVGLAASSKAMGAVAADYTHDGDLDLFVGRPASSGEYFYKTDSRSGANSLGRNYVKVRLDSPLKGNNRQGIGAAVTVTAGDLVQTRVVDGGSGRGGQQDRDLIFGLGDYSGAVTATVKWPRGHVQSGILMFVSGPATADSTNTVMDETMVISNLNATSIVVPGTTLFDWVFSWDTNEACDSSLDVLTFDQAGIQNPCWPGWTTLTPSSPGVVYTYEPKPGGGYLHRFTVYGQECNLNCSFSYSAFSAMGANQTTSATKTKQVKFCPSGF